MMNDPSRGIFAEQQQWDEFVIRSAPIHRQKVNLNEFEKTLNELLVDPRLAPDTSTPGGGYTLPFEFPLMNLGGLPTTQRKQ